MRIAIVHELLIKLGGAERVVKVLSDMFPDAPIFTLLYDQKKCGKKFPKNKVITSYLQKWYNLKTPLNILRTKMPQAIESFDFSDFDLVISSSSAFAHGILTSTETKHLCYCHSPARFLWDWYFEVIKQEHLKGILGPIKKNLIPKIAHKQRIWDFVAGDRPDQIIANSKTVQKRISKYWRQESEIIFPPVNVESFTPSGKHEGYFLIVSALQPYKRIDIAVEAFSKIPKHKLIIIGDGNDRQRLESMKTKNIEFLGRKSDAVVKEYMQNARAFVFPGLEDFGMAPIEAMASGKPVIALKQGGLSETVIENHTGVFFDKITAESLLDGLTKFFEMENSFDYQKIRKHAENFSIEKFEKKIIKEINKLMD